MADKPPNPPASTDENTPNLGWNGYAERLNGRFAMIGLLVLILLEVFTHQDVFTWLGLK